MSDYDQKMKEIEAYNQPILDAFREWLKASGLVEKTIRSHIENIDFFADYLMYYEPLSKLDEADEGDVHMFLLDWFPRKAMWASQAHTKSYMSSFRKFFKFMVESKRIDSTVEIEVRESLKENKDEYLEAVEFDDMDDDFGW